MTHTPEDGWAGLESSGFAAGMDTFGTRAATLRPGAFGFGADTPALAFEALELVAAALGIPPAASDTTVAALV